MYKRILSLLVMLIVVMNVAIAFAEGPMDERYYNNNFVIPKEYGRLVQISNSGKWWYFEANDGTIRILEVGIYDDNNYYVSKIFNITIKRK